MNVCRYVCMHVLCMCVCRYVCIYVRMCRYVCLYVCLYVCIILVPFILLVHTAYEDGTECSETSAYKIQTLGIHPKKEYTTFRTRRKFEIKKNSEFFYRN